MASVAPPAESSFAKVNRDIIGALWAPDWKYRALIVVLLAILGWATTRALGVAEARLMRWNTAALAAKG